ncbi:MAG: DegV family protein [Erysipelotrichaceae bacterium]|nr:DegV family protein [Erysipelotrichaceae bacterium]
MKKVAFVCDSSADITKEEAAALNIHVIRMPIIIDGEPYIEEETISDAQIIEALKKEAKVTTTQPSLGEILSMWDALLKDHDEVFYLPLSRELSGTCRNAIQLAKEEPYAGKVIVVDSTFACYPIIKMIEIAKDMYAKGYDGNTIKEKFETEGELFAILIPENLTTLKNGGRISPAAAALGGLLKIHPLLKVDQGAIDVQDKVRTLSKAYKAGIDACLKGIDPNDYLWMIIDADNRKVSDEMKTMLEEACGQPVEQRIFKAVIMSHTGPGTIAFGRIKKIKYE